jgi:hypothetical protein
MIGWFRRWFRSTPAPTGPVWERAFDQHGREINGVLTRPMSPDEIAADRRERQREAPTPWLRGGRRRR